MEDAAASNDAAVEATGEDGFTSDVADDVTIELGAVIGTWWLVRRATVVGSNGDWRLLTEGDTKAVTDASSDSTPTSKAWSNLILFPVQ